MSDWDEKAADQAAATIHNPPSPTATELSRARGRREGFVWGARWRRNFLLDDETVERAARAALAAALGEDESNE